jgi:hypothetical protein
VIRGRVGSGGDPASVSPGEKAPQQSYSQLRNEPRSPPFRCDKYPPTEKCLLYPIVKMQPPLRGANLKPLPSTFHHAQVRWSAALPRRRIHTSSMIMDYCSKYSFWSYV